MEEPKFPKGFEEKYCSQVSAARSWRKHFNLEADPEDDLAHAECAFVRRGLGLECESCRFFLTRPIRTNAEKEYLVAIEKYYADYAIYEKEEEKRRQELENAKGEQGAYI